ncbi:MAG: hypothetical protein ABR520_10000 [Mycobacteriales bacterium]|nr:hypothetical protein [Frankia sp.]
MTINLSRGQTDSVPDHDSKTGKATMEDFERLMTEAYDEGVVTEVIRPAAILPESAAREVLVELALHDVHANGLWDAQPSLWRRYDTPWDGVDGGPGRAQLLGTMQVAYGTPTRYEITIYRVTITKLGQEHELTVEALCDEALGFGGYSLATCPRAQLTAPPRPFRMPASRPQ